MLQHCRGTTVCYSICNAEIMTTSKPLLDKWKLEQFPDLLCLYYLAVNAPFCSLSFYQFFYYFCWWVASYVKLTFFLLFSPYSFALPSYIDYFFLLSTRKRDGKVRQDKILSTHNQPKKTNTKLLQYKSSKKLSDIFRLVVRSQTNPHK